MPFLRDTCLAFIVSLAACLLVPSFADAETALIPVHVVVVTTFDTGDDVGAPGEFSTWVTKEPFRIVIPFPQGYHHLRYDPNRKILLIETGEGPLRAAASIEALANDPRFDLRRAYWLLAGIAGVDPNVAPAGSVAWASYVVDGDLAFEIDAREMPPSFPTGHVPLGRTTPYQLPAPAASSISGTNLFHLDGGLVRWAYEFSRDRVRLPDTADLRALRAEYASFPATRSPPLILKGDVLASGTFWLGARLNAWAEHWVDYWSHGQAVFTMSAEEDAGYLQAMSFLARAGQVDFGRVLDLRAASDFTVPHPGQSAADLLAHDSSASGLSAFPESLNDVFLAGSAVVNEIADHWDRYGPTTPSAGR